MPKLVKALIVNVPLVVLGLGYWWVWTVAEKIPGGVWPMLGYIWFKNNALLFGLDWATKERNDLGKCSDEDRQYVWWDVFKTCLVEIMSLVGCLWGVGGAWWDSGEFGWGVEMLMFPFVTFLFEIVFDLFHYITHRLGHRWSWLYRFHKVHHEYTSNLNIYQTFHHHLVDLLATNFIPMVLTYWVVRMSPFMLCMWMVYKVFIELSGHMAKDIGHVSSFPQCVWLPRLMGIELYNENHYKHHIVWNCNYAKRCKLWDQVFGTFRL